MNQSISQSALQQAKIDLRQRMSAQRQHATLAVPQADQAIAEHFHAHFAETIVTQAVAEKPYCVGAYHAIGSEINPHIIMQNLSAQGVVLALPAVVDKHSALVFRHYRFGDTMIRESLGTSAPASDKPLCDPDMLLVPLLAFDTQGYRLGYGGGFYDRTLAAFRKRGHACRLIGLAYAAQQVAQIPRDQFDLPLEAVVTEDGVVWASSGKKSS